MYYAGKFECIQTRIAGRVLYAHPSHADIGGSKSGDLRPARSPVILATDIAGGASAFGGSVLPAVASCRHSGLRHPGVDLGTPFALDIVISSLASRNCRICSRLSVLHVLHVDDVTAPACSLPHPSGFEVLCEKRNSSFRLHLA